MYQKSTTVNAVSIIIDWWKKLFAIYPNDRFNFNVESRLSNNELDLIIKDFPYILPREVRDLYQYCNSELEVAPLVYFLNIEQALDYYCYCYKHNYTIKQFFLSLNLKKLPLESFSTNFTDKIYASIINDYPYEICLFPVLRGWCKEIYYITCQAEEVDTSPVWIQFPEQMPILYTNSLTNLILTYAECYETNAFYFQPYDGEFYGELEQDLKKVELIFEKYNPEQINIWRSLWV